MVDSIFLAQTSSNGEVAVQLQIFSYHVQNTKLLILAIIIVERATKFLIIYHTFVCQGTV